MSNSVPSASRGVWSDQPSAAAVVKDAPHDDVATAREPALPLAYKTMIVGIGASAGGLEAITLLIGRLTPQAPMAYVVLQHLSPSHRSMMVEILSRETSLRVKELEQGDIPEAGVIYVVPSNSNALLKDGHLTLVSAPPEVAPKPSINQFFISLAAEEGESAIGIVLSGTGSDGVAGLRAIQVAGGFTLAQQPETAKYDGMPRSAIEAGVVDHVLAPEQMPERLLRCLGSSAETAAEVPPSLVGRLLERLRDAVHVDFSGYKTGTLLRRIRRRQMATGREHMADYLDWVEAHPGELDLLARDILISVTAFFRDRESFQALERFVRDLAERKPPGGEVRVWVAGCASGEEAYSIAMLLAEALGERLSSYRVQVFATDIDEEALNVARRGVYPAAAMSEVPEALLDRYFRPVSQAYEAGKLLRDMIVFARHNLVSDPPFLRLDLVSCRNVLIYFDAALQAKVLQTFRFGLGVEGCLFLGRSESVAQAESCFTPINRRERLFRKSGEAAVPPGPAQVATRSRSPLPRRDNRPGLLLAGMAEHFRLAALLCDHEGLIQHSVGEVDRYLQFPVGASRLALGEVVLPGLRGEALTLLRRYQTTGRPQRSRRRRVGEDLVRLHLAPVSETGGQMMLVMFLPDTPVIETEAAPEAPASDDGHLEDELAATREHLQTMIEELATANEEMQALNEEAQASNEELQATNEEMEAANEELQASNEELSSLNTELNVKTIELARLSSEYVHLYDALDFAVLVFDRQLLLIRFNATAARQFDLRPIDVRQHASRLRLPSALNDLEPLLMRVLGDADRQQLLVSLGDRRLRVNVTPGLDRTGEIVSLVASITDVTDLTRVQAALTESEQRLNALMANTTVIFAMKDSRGAYLYANRRFGDFFGLDAGGVVGKTDYALLPGPLATVLWSQDLEALRLRRQVSVEHRVEHGDGVRYLQAVHQPLFDEQGNPVALIMEAEDITLRKHAEEQLKITARVFDQAGEAIVVTDADSVVQTANVAFTHITGYPLGEAIGRKIDDLLESGRHRQEFYADMRHALTNSGFWQGEVWNRRKDGDIYPGWLTINRVDDALGRPEHYVTVFSDISDMKNAQRKAEYLATHDGLTGLPNRALFHDRLRHALAQARRRGQRLALLFIDLDDFKTINDTLGHDIGDELLKQAADRLQHVIRETDTAARLGGDEFTAILTDCDAQAASLISRRIVDELSVSFPVQGRQLFVSASVGVAFYPDDGNDSNGLIKAADAAMYRAKEMGRNRVEYFVPELQVRLLKRATLESALRVALRAGHLRLVYQPKYSVNGRQALIGAEALLRWHDPELGDLRPDEFIPVAEASGLIIDVTRRVHALLGEQIAAWIGMGLVVPPIACNCSPRSVREPGLGLEMVDALKALKVPCDRLLVEVTEGALLDDSHGVAENLQYLHDHGIQVSIDDFGTGYSSLAYLKRLPVSEVKIDKRFVDGLGQDPEDEAITDAILSMARALGLRTVAEGVESSAQLDWLRRHHCDAAQGFLLARPMEVDAYEDLLVGRDQA